MGYVGNAAKLGWSSCEQHIKTGAQSATRTMGPSSQYGHLRRGSEAHQGMWLRYSLRKAKGRASAI